MNDDPPLISVVIPFYNNGYYILDTLKSIFDQTYSRIEIIITDDGSDFFPLIDIIDYINIYKKENVERVRINNNPINLGTVKNIEKAIDLCKGQIITLIAADDIFHSNSVFEEYINYYKSLPDDAEYVTGQIEMWDRDMSHKISNFVSNEDIEMIKQSSPLELLNAMSTRCILPPQGFWKCSYFEKIGKLSEYYKVIEDYTGATRACRLGIKIYFLDCPISKHRDGGISHGCNTYGNELRKAFIQDEINYFKYEIRPYKSLISDEQYINAYKLFVGRVDYLNKITIKNPDKQSRIKQLIVKVTQNKYVKALYYKSIYTKIQTLILCFIFIIGLTITFNHFVGIEMVVEWMSILCGILGALIIMRLVPHSTISTDIEKTMEALTISLVLSICIGLNSSLLLFELSLSLGYMILLVCQEMRRKIYG